MSVTKRHCAQALILLVALLVVLVLAIYIPWQGKMSFYTERQEKLSERLEAYSRMLAQKPLLEKRLERVTDYLSTSELYFRMATAELAGAELQRRIRTVVDTTDAKLISTQSLGVADESGQKKISVRVRLSGDINAVSKILYELEAETPVTIIQNLSMRSKRVSIRRRSKDRGGIQHLIDVNFDLVGFLQLNDHG